MHTEPPPSPRNARRLVIVPAFNEAGSIGHVVGQLEEHLPEYDVLVVDDGSTDATARAVPGSARVVSLPFNQGIGGAMQIGYRYAAMHGYDAAVQVDGDGQHPAAEVRRLVDHLKSTGADLVVGSRFLDPGGVGYSPPASRMVGIQWLRTLLTLLTGGRRFTDCTSGFRAAGREVIHAFAYWYPEDYPEPEVLLLLHRAGYAIEEIPVQMAARESGRTSIPFGWGLFYVLKVSVALLLALLRKPWPQSRVTPPAPVRPNPRHTDTPTIDHSPLTNHQSPITNDKRHPFSEEGHP